MKVYLKIEDDKGETWAGTTELRLQEPNSREKKEDTQQEYSESNVNFDTLSKKSGISISNLNEIYDFEADPFSLNPGRITGTTQQQQVVAAKLILYGHLVSSGEKEIDAGTLKSQIDDSGINTNNLSRTLAADRNIKPVKSSARSKTKYRLLGPGKVEALELLNELVHKSE